MKGATQLPRSKRSLGSIAFDITMISCTCGSASIANMLHPGLGSALIGALIGAVIGFRILRSVD